MERLSGWFTELQNDYEDAKYWAEHYLGVVEDETLLENTIQNESSLTREEALRLWEQGCASSGSANCKEREAMAKRQSRMGDAAIVKNESAQFRFTKQQVNDQRHNEFMNAEENEIFNFNYDSDQKSEGGSSTTSLSEQRRRNVKFNETVTIFRF
ncbi:hypothetical protein FVE85_0958 [Porphyridium purpureum]|uniref:Uncharacterized protein n=1 Tax=Porphyridium purpureum TaxID=35688 RepID=A0A5J4Z030_PORPP|nr:hypothetical protein FVE85_0958 [Porphyridium purpureum]|eukprot:POR3566..scf208_2